MPPPLYLGCAALGRLDRDADDPEALVTAALESPAYAGFDVAAHHGDAETALGDCNCRTCAALTRARRTNSWRGAGATTTTQAT